MSKITSAVKSLFGFDTPVKEVIQLDEEGKKFFYSFGLTGFSQDTRTVPGQITAYTKCPPVSTIINKKATAFRNGKWWILDRDGKEAKGAEIEKIRALLSRPNPLQTWNQFMIQAKVYEQACGEVFIIALFPVGFSKSSTATLWVVPNGIFKVKYSGKFYNQIQLSDIITEYYIEANGQKTPIDAERVIHIKDIGVAMNNDPGEHLNGQSRLVAQQEPVSNLLAAYEARNVLITRRGPNGILTNNGKDVAGAIPLKEEDKAEIQSGFQKQYGLSKKQAQIIITGANLRWQAMSFATKDLMLFEEIEDDVRSIADAYDYPMFLLGFKDGTTFSNVGEAKKTLYQDAIIPEAAAWAEAFTRFFELDKKGLKFEITFDHLEIFQQSDKERADALKSKVEANMPLLEKNLITLNEFLTAIDYDTRPDGDKVLSEIQSMPLAVKLQVGGTQALQAIIVDPNLTPQQKKQLLIILFGLSEQDANAITTA
jgi:hypothetical protein